MHAEGAAVRMEVQAEREAWQIGAPAEGRRAAGSARPSNMQQRGLSGVGLFFF